jgi:hypothetical protein
LTAAGRPPRRSQCGHPPFQVDEYLVARDFAVQCDRTHVFQFGMPAEPD